MGDFYNMKVISAIFLSLIYLLSNTALSQADNNVVSVVDTSIDPAGYIVEKNLPPASVEGNIYLDDEWKYGSIKVIGGELLEGLQLRFDLQHNNLEFVYKGDEPKVCPLYLLDSYEVQDKKQKTKFKNVANTNLKKFKITGVAQILYSGNVVLYSYTSLNIQEPTYKVEFNMGRRTKRVIKKNTYYLDHGSDASKITGALKKNTEAFGDRFDKVESFAKKYKLNAKNEADLIQLIKYYDEVLKGNNSL